MSHQPLYEEPQVLISGLKFPESPTFDAAGNLWFVEILGGNLSRWDGHLLTRFNVAGTPNGMVFDEAGMIWFCDSERGEVRTFDPTINEFKTICNCLNTGEKLKRPNDLIFDGNGNLLFSDHADGRKEAVSTICVLPKGCSGAKVISHSKLFTNGLAFGNDGRMLIFSETYNQQLWIGEWDCETLELNNERLFAKAGKGPWGPDGIAFDVHSNLYVTVFNEGLINVYKPDGSLVRQLACKGNRPTSCTFDPSGKLGLVVTEAENGEVILYL